MVGEIVLTSNDVSQRSEKMKLGRVFVLKKMYSGFSESDNMLEALVNLAELIRASGLSHYNNLSLFQDGYNTRESVHKAKRNRGIPAHDLVFPNLSGYKGFDWQ